LGLNDLSHCGSRVAAPDPIYLANDVGEGGGVEGEGGNKINCSRFAFSEGGSSRVADRTGGEGWRGREQNKLLQVCLLSGGGGEQQGC
jgi:hypothetical protein